MPQITHKAKFRSLAILTRAKPMKVGAPLTMRFMMIRAAAALFVMITDP